ncbi:hypothetical protein [uncultured Desulfovibrio sp.]|uniref:hypothetical protein n=1 Tax=uncultured Desulfovibrio sp. TaxID=167968 RepID=UPI002711F15B|nr:hypothetical protein [uncultured Desulfovibrio sp.]
MSKTFEYGAENRWHDQYFARALAVTADGIDTDALAVGAHHGSLCVTLAANGDGVNATELCMSILESDEAAGNFEEKTDGPTLMVSGAFEDGAILARLVLPDCKDFVKMHLEGTLTGKVDVFLNYLAR